MTPLRNARLNASPDASVASLLLMSSSIPAALWPQFFEAFGAGSPEMWAAMSLAIACYWEVMYAFREGAWWSVSAGTRRCVQADINLATRHHASHAAPRFVHAPLQPTSKPITQNGRSAPSVVLHVMTRRRHQGRADPSAKTPTVSVACSHSSLAAAERGGGPPNLHPKLRARTRSAGTEEQTIGDRQILLLQ
jgi:hypothetical protein